MYPKSTPNLITLRKQFRIRPNFSEIAREMGVTPSFVRRVFWGLSTSKRISAAIERKLRANVRRHNGERAA